MKKLTDVVKEYEKHDVVSKEYLKKFFETLDYSKAVINTDKFNVHVKFNSDVIKVKDYPFPREEESKEIFNLMGISNVNGCYSRNCEDFFRTFEFDVDKNKMNNFWYK